MKTTTRLTISFLLLLLASSVAKAQDDDQQYQLRWVPNSLKETSEEAMIGSVLQDFLTWHKDANGETSALLRIQVQNMASVDVAKLQAKISTGLAMVVKQELHDNLAIPELWVFVSPENFSIDVYSDSYKSRPYDMGQKLESRHIYMVTLNCVKQIDITMMTFPVDVQVFVDGQQAKDKKAKVSSGNHRVTFSRNGVKMNRDTIITVSEENYVFRFDLRQQYTVHVTSDPSGADVFVRLRDNLQPYGTTPVDITLPEGSYQMITRYQLKMADTSLLNVSPTNKKTHINLEQKKRVEIHAMYQGRNTPANLYIRRTDGPQPKVENIDGRKSSFNVTLPYGRYSLTMTNDQNSGQREITIRENSPISFAVEIKPKRKKIVMPWKRAFEEKPGGFYVGLTSRQLSNYFFDNKAVQSIGPAWRNVDEYLYGIKTGFHFQPCLNWGLGIYFGAFLEYYWTKSPLEEQTYSTDEWADYYSNYSEKAISVPIHLYYRLPLTNTIAVSAHGGLDIDMFFGAKYTDKGDYYLTNTPKYGDNFHKRFNIGYSYGASIQFDWFMLEAMWHYSITDQEMFDFIDDLNATYFTGFTVGLSILF